MQQGSLAVKRSYDPCGLGLIGSGPWHPIYGHCASRSLDEDVLAWLFEKVKKSTKARALHQARSSGEVLDDAANEKPQHRSTAVRNSACFILLERKEWVELGKGDPSCPSLLHMSMSRRRKLDSISQEDELGSCASKFAIDAGGGQQLTMSQLLLMPGRRVNRAFTCMLGSSKLEVILAAG